MKFYINFLFNKLLYNHSLNCDVSLQSCYNPTVIIIISVATCIIGVVVMSTVIR